MKKIILPVLVLGALLFASRILITMRPEPQPKEVVKQIPFVEVIEARPVNLRSSINTFGTVRPQTLTTLIAEVPGVIEDIAPIINEKALIKYIKNKKIGGIGLDVFENEPLKRNHIFKKFNNAIFGSHNAFNTKEAVNRTNDDCVLNLIKALKK